MGHESRKLPIDPLTRQLSDPQVDNNDPLVDQSSMRLSMQVSNHPLTVEEKLEIHKVLF